MCQKSGDTVGFLGNKTPMYKTLQRRSRYPYKMIVTWCGVRLGGGREARRRDQMASPQSGAGHSAIAAAGRLQDPGRVGEADLGFIQL